MSKTKTIKTALACLGLAGGLMALAVPALGGAAVPPSNREVRVTVGSWADGVLRATRASADDVAYLACVTYTTTSGEQGRCSARDADGDYVTCYTNNARMLTAIRSIQPDSRVYFRAISGACDMIEVHMDTTRLP